MKIRTHKFSLLFLILLTIVFQRCIPGRESQESPVVRNGDFETGENLEDSGWTWWSIHGDDAGSAVFSDVAREGSRSVKIEHEGEELQTKDWLLISKQKLDVRPGEEWTVSAWVKYEDTDMIGIELMGMAQGKEITNFTGIHKYLEPPRQGLWPSGYDATFGTGDWELLEASAIIPPEIDQVYVRIGGIGKTKAWIDNVELHRGLAKRTAPPKPKVEGWAFDSERVDDRLGRRLVAMPLENGDVYVQWTLLERDEEGIAFNVYRSEAGGAPMKLNDRPLSVTTDFIDKTANLKVENVYMVRSVDSDLPFGPSDKFTLVSNATTRPYLSFPLKDKDTEFNMSAVGDLNGDGLYDFVIKTPARSLDPVTWRPSEYTYKLEAYLSDGTFLWRKDLGWNIEGGTWYSPYVVYDLDGDGKAEVAVKTAPMDEDYRSTDSSQFSNGRYRFGPGRVNTGSEYVSILDGMTGEEVTRANWPSRDGLGRYNHKARHQMGVAYLDGKTPALVVLRGTYTVIKVDTYHYQDGRLEKQWYWDSTHEPGGLYFGQGSHTMHAADIDEDGRDEIIPGGFALDDNGDAMWTQGVYHPDNNYVSDIDPARPGLEIYFGIEGTDAKGTLRDGMRLVDARTGALIWGFDKPTYHMHGKGLVSNIDPTHPGMECYSGERHTPERWLHTAKGELIADETEWSVGLAPGVVYWDASPEREVVVGDTIVIFPDTPIAAIEGRRTASLDLLGDWREEIITSVPGELRVYITGIPAKDRRVSFMEDPFYRNAVAHQSMGYPPVPLTSYYIPSETEVMRQVSK